MSIIFQLSTVDALDLSPQAFQEALMFKVVGDFTLDSELMHIQNPKGLIDHCGDKQDVCRWKGVKCASKAGIVRRVCWNPVRINDGVRLIHFNLQWLPPTIRTLEVSDQHVENGIFSTRFFPRLASKIDLKNNGHKGSLDMTTLPCELVCLILSRNSLHGPVVLTRLLETLTTLKIRHNRISKVIVRRSDMPGESTKAEKNFRFDDSCKIKYFDW
mmetsp:Transcript_11637/g.17635  ORF Transcript_11637/g.17635 Transcript_11637/m.17635 type:complete len:215 (-) Transcript_11637:8-652(-)